jgi:hypothetical protein
MPEKGHLFVTKPKFFLLSRINGCTWDYFRRSGGGAGNGDFMT